MSMAKKKKTPLYNIESLYSDRGFYERVHQDFTPGINPLLRRPTSKYRTGNSRPVEVRELMALSTTALPTLEEIKQALYETSGDLTSAARGLGMYRRILDSMCKTEPILIAALQEIEQINVDAAEKVLRELVAEKNVTAVTFTLRTKGKDRGYNEKTELEHTIGAGSAAGLISAMREGAGKDEQEPLLLDVDGSHYQVIEEDDDDELFFGDDARTSSGTGQVLP